VSASVNLPLHHKVQKFSSGTSSPGWSRKKGRKTVVLVVCILYFAAFEMYSVFQLHFHRNSYLKYNSGRTGFYTDRFRFPSMSEPLFPSAREMLRPTEY